MFDATLYHTVKQRRGRRIARFVARGQYVAATYHRADQLIRTGERALRFAFDGEPYDFTERGQATLVVALLALAFTLVVLVLVWSGIGGLIPPMP